jgi:hypothetical protein
MRSLNSTLRRWLLALAWGFALLALARPAAAETVPVDDYWQRLAALRAQLNGLTAQPPEAQHAVLSAAASAWENVTAVTLTGGVTVPVDHRALAAALRAEKPDLAALVARLDALLAAHADWPAPRHRAESLERLNAILARPEYQWPDAPPNPLADLWNRLLQAILRFLNNLLPDAVTANPGLDLLGWLFTALCVAVVVAIVLYATRGMFSGLVREVTLPADAALEEGALSPDQAAQRAQGLAGQGDYRSAVRYLYLSALLSLEARGLLRYERALTNREVLRRLSDHPELAAPMREVVEVFDRVWYGFQPVDAGAYDQYAARVAALRQAHG